MTRLTTAALDALIAEHRGITRETGFGTSTDCADLQCPEWPCDIYLLAAEVRAFRRAKDVIDHRGPVMGSRGEDRIGQLDALRACRQDFLDFGLKEDGPHEEGRK